MFQPGRLAVALRLVSLRMTSRVPPLPYVAKRFNGTKGPDGSNLLEQRDIYGPVDLAPNSIVTCLPNGILFQNLKVIETPNENNEIAAAILLGEEIFEVTLSNSPEDNFRHDQTVTITNGFHVDFNEERVLSLFAAVCPKPDIVVVGLGKKFRVLSEANKKFFNDLGIALEVSDTRNACNSWDLLTVERRGDIVGALILPPNF